MGGLFLLNTLGIMVVNVWRVFWPALLIVLGLWVLINVMAGPARAERADVYIPLQGAQKGHVHLRYGAGRLAVSAGAREGELLGGTFEGGIDYRTRRTESGLEAILSSTSGPFFLWPQGPREWHVNLTNAVPLSLDIEVGAAEARYDLTDLRVTDLKLETGASETELTLPARAGFTRARIKSGAAEVRVHIPEGVAARIKATGGLADIQVDSSRFPRQGDVYWSANYDSAEHKVEIDAETGVGSLKIN
jgi:hypothetical protein